MLSAEEIKEINGTFDALYEAVEAIYKVFEDYAAIEKRRLSEKAYIPEEILELQESIWRLSQEKRSVAYQFVEERYQASQIDNIQKDILKLQKDILELQQEMHRLTQEEVSINAEDATEGTVITKLVAKEGKPALKTAWWLVDNICGASKAHIVEGFGRRGDIKAAYEWMHGVEPIWLAIGLAFGGHQKAIEPYIEQYSGGIAAQSISTVGLLAFTRLIASAILGGKIELYHMLRERMVSVYRTQEISITQYAKALGMLDDLSPEDVEIRLRQTASIPLVIIAQALGVSGNQEMIEEFLQWIEKDYGPTVFQEWPVDPEVHCWKGSLITGLARGNHRAYLASFIAREEADGRRFLPQHVANNLIYYKLKGAAQGRNISYLEEILEPYRVFANAVDHRDFRRYVHFVLNCFFEDGYQRIVLALAKHYYVGDSYLLFDQLSGILKGHILIMQRKIEESFSKWVARGTWAHIDIRNWAHHAFSKSFYKPLFYYDTGYSAYEAPFINIRSPNGSCIDEKLPRWAPLESQEKTLGIILHPTIDREKFCEYIVEPIWGKEVTTQLQEQASEIEEIDYKYNLGNSAAMLFHANPGAVPLMTKSTFWRRAAVTGEGKKVILPLEIRRKILSFLPERPNALVIDELFEEVPHYTSTYNNR